jgi:hypothetical protein
MFIILMDLLERSNWLMIFEFKIRFVTLITTSRQDQRPTIKKSTVGYIPRSVIEIKTFFLSFYKIKYKSKSIWCCSSFTCNMWKLNFKIFSRRSWGLGSWLSGKYNFTILLKSNVSDDLKTTYSYNFSSIYLKLRK